MTTTNVKIPADYLITQERYAAAPLDPQNYLVIDLATSAEICMCAEFDESIHSAQRRAEAIAFCLNYIGFDILTDGIPPAFKEDV